MGLNPISALEMQHFSVLLKLPILASHVVQQIFLVVLPNGLTFEVYVGVD